MTIRKNLEDAHQSLSAALEALSLLLEDAESGGRCDLMSETQIAHLFGYADAKAFLRRPKDERPPCYVLSRKRRIYSGSRAQAWLEARTQR